MPLTPSQQTAFAQFEAFVNSNENVFILKGSAGTGKTTLLKAMVESLDNQWKSVLMAPTGRAAYVLSGKTNRNAATIHRSIYTIEEGLKYDGTGQLIFSLRHNEDSLSKTIYFVDEASMISDKYSESDMYKFGSGFLLKDLFEYCGARKIVFVGDYAQLPPVGQAMSPAMSAEYIEQKYQKTCKEFMLRDIVRQVADSSILKNASFVRNAIETSTFNEFVISDGEDVKNSNSILEDYKNVTCGSIDENTIIIAYSNKQVLDYNIKIREMFFNNAQERLLPGDLLLVSQNNYYNTVELFNGTIVRVLDCANDNMLEKRNVHFYSGGKNEEGQGIIKEMELVFRQVTIETPTHDQLKCFILDNFLTDPLGTVSKEYYQALMTDFNNRMTKNKIKQGSDEYRSCIKTDKYLHALICKYGYAITCHKAQGGEWENVFADMDKLGGKTNSDYFRWAYTAITRSSKQLWHFASPSFNAVSKMIVMPIGKTDKVVYYVPSGENFLDWHFERINSLCAEQGIVCKENRDFTFQHLLTFEKDGKCCTFKQWYRKDGYSTKRELISTNDNDFSSLVEQLIELSLIPKELPFEPKTEFASKLHELVMSIADELSITILNIRQEQWKDIYYLKTHPYVSTVSFNYNAKGMYSSVTPQSTGGEEDLLLKTFCEKLQ